MHRDMHNLDSWPIIFRSFMLPHWHTAEIKRGVHILKRQSSPCQDKICESSVMAQVYTHKIHIIERASPSAQQPLRPLGSGLRHSAGQEMHLARTHKIFTPNKNPILPSRQVVLLSLFVPLSSSPSSPVSHSHPFFLISVVYSVARTVSGR